MLKRADLLDEVPTHKVKAWYAQGIVWAGMGGHADDIAIVEHRRVKGGGVKRTVL